MTQLTVRTAQIGFSVLAVIILTTGISVDAIAKAGKRHHSHAQIAATEGLGNAPVKSVQLVPEQQTRLGPMRYYGGPKSPMWRGPVEN